MDTRVFPFDKLIKIVLIVIITTLPFLFYYYLHTKQQTDYLNQRNFRALNEIILQYQNHFEALSNLFKFPPPPPETAYYAYQFDDQTISNLNEVKQILGEIIHNDYIEGNKISEWINWYGSQLDEINSLENFSKLNTIENLTTFMDQPQEALKTNISKKIAVFKGILGKAKKLKKRNQLSNIIKQLNTVIKLLQESQFAPRLEKIIDNKEIINIYRSRLRLNESLGDISVSKFEDPNKLNNPDEPCFSKNNTKFVLDENDKPATVKSFGCGYQYKTTVPSLFGNIRHNEFDAILLVDKSGKVLFSKELKALDWKKDIESHDQTNYTGLAVSNIKHILKNAADNAAIKNSKKENKTKPANTDNLAIGFSTSQTENIGGKEYIFFIQPFKLNYRLDKSETEHAPQSTQFYLIGLVDDAQFRKEILSIPAVLSAFVFTILFFGILSWPTLKLNFIGIREHISRGDIRFLLISLFITSGVVSIFFCSILTIEIMEKRLNNENITIGQAIDKDFKAHIQEITREFNIYKNEVLKVKEGDYRKNNEKYLANKPIGCDLRISSVSNSKERKVLIDTFQADYKSRKRACKILIIDSKKATNRWTIAGFNSEGLFKKGSITYSRKKLLMDDLAIELKNTPLNRRKIIELAAAKINLSLPEVKTIFPSQRDIFKVNEYGVLFQKIHFFVDDFYTAGKLNIKNRDYFKQVLKGKAWFTESNDTEDASGYVYLQRIRNYSDGIKSTQMAMPISSEEFKTKLPEFSYDKSHVWKHETETSPPKVISSTTYFQSLIAPVLPYGFQYAIIDDASGTVLYHSEDDKAFAENFYSETEYNNELIAAIKSGKEPGNSLSHSNNEIPLSISGKYHADLTNFHVIPLKTVPWSLITFYPRKIAHSIGIQSGITAFISFLLYATCFYFVISFGCLCLNLLKNNDALSLTCLWPEINKKHQYNFLSLLLIPYCLIYLLGVFYINGMFLIFYLMLAMLTQILLVYATLHKPWMCNESPLIAEDESSLKQGPLFIFLLFIGITLLFIYQSTGIGVLFLENNLMTLPIFLTVAGICLFLWRNPLERSQYSFFRFKSIYILMVTLILLLFSSIPSIALYKDALSLYSAIHSRQSQLEIANKVQHRYSRLDTFAKLFFPKVHAMSNGHTQCSTFNFADKYSGVYGLSKTALDLNINKPGTDNACSTTPHNDHHIDDNSIFDSRFSSHLFKPLAGLDLYLSEQYATAQGHFIEKGWHYDNNDTLTFTTRGISGKLEHKIAAETLDLSTIISTLYKTDNESFSIPARVVFMLLVCFLIYRFFRRMSFIVQRVFGIDIPEIVKNNKIENLIRDELELSGQCLVFINGVEKNIKEFCLDKCRTNKNAAFVLEPVKNSDLEKFVSCAEMKGDDNDESTFTFFVVSEFFIATNKQETRLLLLDYLEKIQKAARPDNKIFILFCSAIHPLRCLLKPHLYANTQMQHFASIADQEEKYRWIRVLTKFLEYNNYAELQSADIYTTTNNRQLKQLRQYIDNNIFWPDSSSVKQKAHDFVEKNKKTHEINKEDIIEYIGNQNYPYYHRLWSLCNADERLMLYQLSTDRFVNPLNRGVIRSLYSRGYIMRKPFFQIPDPCFKRFILSAESVSTFQKWEKNANQSLWTNIKVPLFIVLVFLAGLFLYISTDALETTLALLTPLLAFIPLLFRSINTIQASNAVEKVVSTEEA